METGRGRRMARGVAGVIVMLGGLPPALWLFIFTALDGLGPGQAARATLVYVASLSCLLAVVAVFLALLGLEPGWLLPLAAALFILAAVLCYLARSPYGSTLPNMALVCALLALLTPWWTLLPLRLPG